jgi:hypothetical protein
MEDFMCSSVQQGVSAAVVFACGIFLSGCLTMERGPSQVISVDSIPNAANVEVVSEGKSFTTPDEIILTREENHILRIEKKGYQPKSVLIERKLSSGVFRNLFLLFPPGIIAGVIVDMISGSGYNLEPAAVSVELKPTPPVVTATPASP